MDKKSSPPSRYRAWLLCLHPGDDVLSASSGAEFKTEIDAYANLQAEQLRTVYPSLREILSDYPNELAALIEQTYDSLR